MNEEIGFFYIDTKEIDVVDTPISSKPVLFKMAVSERDQRSHVSCSEFSRHLLRWLLVLPFTFPLLFQVCAVTTQDLPNANNEPSNNDIPPHPKQNGINGKRWYGQRSRDHIYKILQLDGEGDTEHELEERVFKQISSIYKNSIKPMEDAYKFNDLNKHIINEAEIYAIPRIVVVGPWSTGKSSLINYLLGTENTTNALLSGAQPTTSDFTVMMYGLEFKTVEGIVLSMDSSYSSLEKFGQKFLDKLLGIKLPSKLLEKVTLIDTPGIIENRKQQERGYPFNEVCQWFLERSDMIVVVFDPTKLDVGAELETLFHQLKGHESKVRIILNKADTISPQELMRIYGALFWNLAPLINVTEPPRVYVGSFWSKDYNPVSEQNGYLFLNEEIDLLNDLRQTIANRFENKIALVRQHAILVRNHALLVDQYLHTFQKHKSIFKDNVEVADLIAENPHEHRIFQTVLSKSDISQRDLPPADDYKEFFRMHQMDTFQPLGKYCNFFGTCYLDSIEYAIHQELPALVEEIEAYREKQCSADSRNCKPTPQKFLNDHNKSKYSKVYNRHP